MPIGVFDSGIGGLSILQALRLALPHEDFVYFADSAHNPYGTKPQEFVVERSLAIVDELVRVHQIKALVVACNTATAAAIAVLRQTYPDMPIVGVEPALKPAAQITRTGRVAVLATRGTLRSEKFAALRDSLPHVNFTCIPCDGLAERIESLSEDAIAAENASDLIALCAVFMSAAGTFGNKNEAIDTLVLGCTHYPLIRDLFRSLLPPGATIIDNALPVAQRTAQLIQGSQAKTIQAGRLMWRSSEDPVALLRAAQYWGVEKAPPQGAEPGAR